MMQAPECRRLLKPRPPEPSLVTTRRDGSMTPRVISDPGRPVSRPVRVAGTGRLTGRVCPVRIVRRARPKSPAHRPGTVSDGAPHSRGIRDDSKPGSAWCRLPGAGRAPRPAAADEKDEGDFKPLFNGKDLTGWVTPDDKALFTVEDGEIVGRTKGDLKKNEFLVTDKPYGDFVLKAKVKYPQRQLGHPVPEQAQARRRRLRPAGRRRRRLLGPALRGAAAAASSSATPRRRPRRWSRRTTGTTS